MSKKHPYRTKPAKTISRIEAVSPPAGPEILPEKDKKPDMDKMDLHTAYNLACSILPPSKRKSSGDEDKIRHIEFVKMRTKKD